MAGRNKRRTIDPAHRTLKYALPVMGSCAFLAQAAATTVRYAQLIVNKNGLKSSPYTEHHLKYPFEMSYATTLFVNLYNLYTPINDMYSLSALLTYCDTEGVTLTPTTHEFRKLLGKDSKAQELVCKNRNTILAHSGIIDSRDAFAKTWGITFKQIDSLLITAFNILEAIHIAQNDRIESRSSVEEKTLASLKWLLARE